MKNAVVVPLKTAARTTQTPEPSMAEQVKAKMAAAFNGIFRNAAEPSPYSPGGLLPQYGPYGMAILYAADGTPKHLLGKLIDRLHFERPFTKNAIQLRCDALGLVVYVSGHPELSGDGLSVTKMNVRMVVFQKDQLNPSYQKTASTPDEVTEKLHGILVNTYNQLAREFSLAGFPVGWLILKAKDGALPDIPLNMPEGDAS